MLKVNTSDRFYTFVVLGSSVLLETPHIWKALNCNVIHCFNEGRRERGKIHSSIKYRCYETIVRRNMHCLVTAGKYVNDIRAIARQPPVTTTEGYLEAMFSVGTASRLYSEEPKPVECSEVVV
jgi:hypothetical protein